MFSLSSITTSLVSGPTPRIDANGDPLPLDVPQPHIPHTRIALEVGPSPQIDDDGNPLPARWSFFKGHYASRRQRIAGALAVAVEIGLYAGAHLLSDVPVAKEMYLIVVVGVAGAAVYGIAYQVQRALFPSR